MAARLLVLTLCLVAQLTNPSFAERYAIAPLERPWSETLVVPAGQVTFVYGHLKPDIGGLLLYGTFGVQSCCGFSTHDIVFRIDALSTGRNSEKMIGSLTFEFDTQEDDYYRLEFDNAWRSCPSPSCEPDTSSPSFHNKTVNLTMREVATFALFSFWGMLPVFAIGVAAAAILVPFLILLKRKTRGGLQKL